ncbi:MAG: hypothetical protein KDC84_12635 [Crocinitomicaceae bacterium]|nr:hypothetical protein [Crocinitomicaceae bacterium]
MRLSIGTPCNENWDEMTPQDKGRFCPKCEKQVYDLTKADDQEILHFFRNKDEKVCGRLTRFQLNHDFFEKSPVSSNSFNRYIAASFTLLALSPAVVAQNNNLNLEQPVEYAQVDILHQKMQGAVAITHDYTIKLLDQDGKALKKAWVSIHGYDYRVQADDNGIVRFDFPTSIKEKEITLYISIDFRYGEVKLEKVDHPVTKEIRVEMHEEILMGDIAPIEEAPIEPVKKCEKKK